MTAVGSPPLGRHGCLPSFPPAGSVAAVATSPYPWTRRGRPHPHPFTSNKGFSARIAGKELGRRGKVQSFQGCDSCDASSFERDRFSLLNQCCNACDAVTLKSTLHGRARVRGESVVTTSQRHISHIKLLKRYIEQRLIGIDLCDDCCDAAWQASQPCKQRINRDLLVNTLIEAPRSAPQSNRFGGVYA